MAEHLALAQQVHRLAAVQQLYRSPPNDADPVLGLLALQGLVGGLQWAMELPSEIVWLHVALATVTWLAMLWTVATAGRLEPRESDAGLRTMT